MGALERALWYSMTELALRPAAWLTPDGACEALVTIGARVTPDGGGGAGPGVLLGGAGGQVVLGRPGDVAGWRAGAGPCPGRARAGVGRFDGRVGGICGRDLGSSIGIWTRSNTRPQ